KFEESQFIYQILRSSVKQALGQNNILSTLDFEQETSFNIPMLKKGEAVRMPEIKVNPDFNPFHTTPNREDKNTSALSAKGFTKLKPSKADWENFYDAPKNDADSPENSEAENEPEQITISSALHEDQSEDPAVEQGGKKKPFQVNDKYILT